MQAGVELSRNRLSPLRTLNSSPAMRMVVAWQKGQRNSYALQYPASSGINGCINPKQIELLPNLLLEQIQYKNDTSLMKNKLVLNLPPFFSHLCDRQKSATNSKLIYFSSKWIRSYIFLALRKMVKDLSTALTVHMKSAINSTLEMFYKTIS